MRKKQSNLVVTKDLLKNGWKVVGIFLATWVCPAWPQNTQQKLGVAFSYLERNYLN